jgi:hypothetical protein
MHCDNAKPFLGAILPYVFRGSDIRMPILIAVRVPRAITPSSQQNKSSPALSGVLLTGN